MSYQALHIPFASGQDEGYDRKVLPIGPMRSIRNMWLERDGRLARRPGIVPRSSEYESFLDPGNVLDRYISGVQVSSTDRVKGLTDNGLIAEDRDDTGTLYHLLYRTNASNEERVVQAIGRPTRVSSIERFHASGGLGDTNQGRANNQTCPCVDTCFDGKIVFAYLEGTIATLEFREPRTLEVMHKVQHEIGSRVGFPSGFSSGDCGPTATTETYKDVYPPTIKVIASKVSNHVVLLSHIVAPNFNESINRYVITEELFDTAGNYLQGYEAISRVVSTYTGTPNSGCFYDAVARPNADSYIYVGPDSTNSTIQVQEVSFTRTYDVSPVLSVKCALSTVTFDTPSTVFAGTRVSCSCSETRWHAASQAEVWTGRFGDTVARDPLDILTSIEANNTVPTAVDIGNNQTKIIWAELQNDWDDVYESAPNIRNVVTKTMIWTHEDGEANVRGDIVDSGFEYPITQAIHVSGGCVSFLAEFGYSYGEPKNTPDLIQAVPPPVGGVTTTQVEVKDVTKEPFWSPAHIVESSGTDNRNYVSATALETGSRYFDYHFTGGVFHPSIWAGVKEPSPGRPLAYSFGGKEYFVYPTTFFSASGTSIAESYPYGQFSATMFRTEHERIGSIRFRGGSAIAGGIIKHAVGDTVIQGFTCPPAWQKLTYYTEANGGLGGDFTLQFCATLEYRDVEGRLWRSAPCAPRSVVLPAIEDDGYNHVIELAFECHSGIPLPSKGCKFVLYATNPDGNTFYRRSEQDVWPGELVTFTWGTGGFTDSNEDAEVLYTTGDVLANGCPPSARFIAESGGRLWAASGTERHVIRASKTINDTLGVEWNSLDSFKVVLPEEVTGMASMDSALVAFTANSVFLIHGSGPDLGGVGAFSEPQNIPCTNGCINHRSVIATTAGVFFQSRRGIEYIPRGFGAPIFAGESVRDTTDQYPYCFGVAQATSDGTVRWLMGAGEDSPTSVVVVFDPRTQAWCTYNYNGNGFTHIRRTDGEITMSGEYVSTIKTEDPSIEAGATDLAWIETGSLRVTGLQSWAFGRRFHLLGEFGGRPCTVRVRMGFNDEEFLPDDVAEWSITTDEYTADAPLELELTLPIQRFSTIRFKIEVQSASDEPDLGYTYKPNGMTLYYSPASEGPRLQSRNTR